MKKVLAMALSLALIATLAISGTVAYLTDTESQVNVMTVGNVDVELNELQRNEDNTALEDFEQGKVAMPYVNASKKDATFNMIEEDNHVDKIVYATNTGKSDAYMRILIAIPDWANTTENPDDPSQNNLHWNYPGDTTSGKIQNWLKENESVTFDTDANTLVNQIGPEKIADGIEIGEKKYDVWSFTFKNSITAGESTNIVMTGLYLDKRVDYDADTGKYLDINGQPIADFDGNIYVPVLVQAVQAAGFADAETALQEAFGNEETEGVVADWFNGIEIISAAPESGAVRPAGYNPVDEGVNTVDGVTVTDASDEKTNLRALYTGDGKKVNGDLIVKNSYLDGTYAMNVIGDDTGVLTVTDTDLRGWVSYDGFTAATFTDCTFGKNSNPEYYNAVRPYSNVTFENCAFDGTEFLLDKLDGAKVTFVNCTMNGNVIDSAEDVNVTYGSADSIEIK